MGQFKVKHKMRIVKWLGTKRGKKLTEEEIMQVIAQNLIFECYRLWEKQFKSVVITTIFVIE